MKNKLLKVMVTTAMCLTMMLSGAISAFASAPFIEDIEYKGNGRVEVDFQGDVRYRNPKVKVVDTKGKTYKVKSIRKDDDDIKFTIKGFKRGKTYKITVSGVKEAGTSKYGKVTGKLKVLAASGGAAISRNQAITKAKNHAKNKWGAKGFWDIEVERDRYQGQSVWEVSFNGDIKGEPYEFEYEIAVKGGKILKTEKEYDD